MSPEHPTCPSLLGAFDRRPLLLPSPAGEDLRPDQRGGRHGGDGGGAAPDEGTCHERGTLPSPHRAMEHSSTKCFHTGPTCYTFITQVDSNKDRLVSLEEFLVATKKKEFLEPDSWEVRPRRLSAQTCYAYRRAVRNILSLTIRSPRRRTATAA